MRELVERIVAEEDGAGTCDLPIGTMIELPRACFVADRIAEHADFFSFGTNDLTQTALGFSRDDVEGEFLDALHRAQGPRPQPVRDDRQAGRRLAGAAGGLGRARGEPRPQARHLRRARRRSRLDRLLPARRARLRELLALPRADRARRRRTGRASPERGACENRLAADDQARTCIVSRADRARRGGAPLPARHALLPGPPAARGARLRPPHAVPARPRPDRPLEGVPAAQAQDAGVHRARGRPLPHAAHPHARGVRHRAQRGAGARPERGPDRGDRARPRPRPPAVRPHRRGGARRVRARALRPCASATTSTRCGSSSEIERDRTSPSRCATGSCTTPGPEPPATLEGRIVRAGRPDRLHQPRHRRRAARRRAALRATCRARRSRCSARPARSGSRRSSTTCSSAPTRPATSSRARRSAARCCACASSCSSSVYLGPEAQREQPRIERMMRALFDHYVEHPPPALDRRTRPSEQRVVD